jgi:hypothetical protein
VSENRELRRIFETMEENSRSLDITASKVLQELHFSSNIIRIMKSRNIKWEQ